MRIRDFAPAVLWLAPLMACGGEGGGGTATSPTPTVTSLSIAPATDLIKLKGSENFTATATQSNGTSNTVSPTWRSDNTAVLTIDSSGRATAVASGAATVIADHQGVTATRLVRVVPDYHGGWGGQMSLRTCQADGDWDGACDDMSPGDLDNIAISITQQRASVTATLDLGGLAGPVTGTIGNDGMLALTGSFSLSMDGIPFEISVVEWQTMSSDNARMTGRMTFSMRSSRLTGQTRLDAELVNVTKTGASLSMRPLPATGELARFLQRAFRR